MRQAWRMRGARLLTVALATGGLAACATAPAPRPSAYGGARVPAYNRPYEVRGRWYAPAEQPRYDEVGVASWYGYESGRTTADGEVFDVRLSTAAHKTLPIPSYLDVTNLDNGRRIRVRLNDRGPFAQGRLIDLSRGAAERLGFLGRGTARVRVQYVGPAPPYGRASRRADLDVDAPEAMADLAQPR